MKSKNKHSLLNKIILCITFIILIFIFSPKVHSYTSDSSFQLYSYKDSIDNKLKFTSKTILYEKNLSNEDKAKFIYKTLLENNINNLFPTNTKILDIYIKKNIIVANFSKEFLDYGGSYYEEALTNLLLKNAENLNNISKLTILVEGEITALSEGNTVFEQNIN